MMANNSGYRSTVTAEGHLVDSGVLSEAMDLIVRGHAAFVMKRFTLGATNLQPSQAVIEVLAPNQQALDAVLDRLVRLGFYSAELESPIVRQARKDGTAPADFYSTTNHSTEVYFRGQWQQVRNQRMDSVIVVSKDERNPACRKLRDVKRGDRVICGHKGIRILPEFKERDRSDFAFMTNDVSSEKKVEWVAGRVAQWIRSRKGRLVVVAGPVVVHTGGGEPLAEMIKRGRVDALLAGNALAVHDVERALYGTSLGVDTKTGLPVDNGHQHHMRAINAIRLAGGLKKAVSSGLLREGIMHSLISKKVPFVLAGSIRDDGPLPEVITDTNQAQDAYASQLQGAEIVLMLSSMLHSIAVGNMLPSWVRTVCVDINAQVVTKLADRGSHQAIGCVTDVGLFLNLLRDRLRSPR
jgi:lysine-ketoglutarate reductase/saccharopine dehydrogenase-like protein (TIGR00300 family)